MNYRLSPIPVTFATFMPLMRSNRFRSVLKIAGWVVLVQFILINISAALYAYKFTHFYESNGQQPSSQNILAKTWRLFVGPKFYKASTEAMPSFPFQNIRLHTQNGLAIHAWYSVVGEAKGCVILMHGVTANKSYLVNEAEAFRRLGYNVLLFDFRGHGLSEGNTTTFGEDETAEVKAAFDFVRSKGVQKIILFGVSLGAVVAIKAVAEGIVQPDGLIAEMPFGSLQNHLKARAKMVGFPSQPFAFLVTFWMGVERGYNAFKHKATRYAAQVHCPVLLQCGNQDPLVTQEEIESVYRNIPSKKRLVTYTAGHESLLGVDVTMWNSEVNGFLKSLR
jgi:alpha-beta hydrolase superfamily lysophospholipase